MDDLVRWLGEQLDADEQTAREAAEELGPDWYYDGGGYVLTRREDTLVATGSHDFLEQERGAHIAEHDPARVLREIDAKRQVLADFEESLKRSKEFSRRAKSGEETEVQKQQRHEENIRLLVLLKVVKQLASACSDRPGYAEALASLG